MKQSNKVRILFLIGLIGEIWMFPVSFGILTLFIGPIEKLIEKSYLNSTIYNQTQIKEIISRGSFISDTYINWLQIANIKTYAIDINMDERELLQEIEKYDGLLLTGGREVFYQNTSNSTNEKIPAEYLKKVEIIINRVKQINDFKRSFPVWSTCLGFEAVLITDSKYTLTRHKVDNELRAPAPISVIKTDTRSFKFFSSKELENMEKNSIVYFNHKFGLFANEVNLNEYLKNSVDIVAVFKKKDMDIVAWYEYKYYPIVGVQFHPEKFAENAKAEKSTLEFEQFSINDKFARLFKSFVERPAVYFKDFHIYKLPKLRTSKDFSDFRPSAYSDRSMDDDKEDQFSLINVGMYEKIEIFMRNNQTRDY